MRTVAITQGDAAGIGPEIIAKSFAEQPEGMRGCFVAGDVQVMRRAAGVLVGPGRTALPVALITEPEEALRVPPHCIPVLQVGPAMQPAVSYTHLTLPTTSRV